MSMAPGRSNILNKYVNDRQKMKSNRIINLEEAEFNNEQKLRNLKSRNINSGIKSTHRTNKTGSSSGSSVNNLKKNPILPPIKPKSQYRSRSRKKEEDLKRQKSREQYFDKRNPNVLRKNHTQQNVTDSNRFNSRKEDLPSQNSLFGNKYGTEKLESKIKNPGLYGTEVPLQMVSNKNKNNPTQKKTDHQQFLDTYHKQKNFNFSFKNMESLGLNKSKKNPRRSSNQGGSSILSQFMKNDIQVSKLIAETKGIAYSHFEIIKSNNFNKIQIY